MVELVLCYDLEVWILNADLKRRRVRMDYLRSARTSKLERKIRNCVDASKTIINRIERKGTQMVWALVENTRRTLSKENI